jgi:hypothetical protein
MTSYDAFDCKANCEELIDVPPEEQEEVFALIAAETEANLGFSHYLDSLEPTERAALLEQRACEARDAQLKNRLNGYSNKQDGAFYRAIAV